MTADASAGAGVPSRAGRFRAALALGLAAAALLCFALPLTLYLGNRAEFHAPLAAVLAPLLVAGVLLALAGAALCAVLPAREYPAAMVFAATLVLLAWVQGYVLVWHYGLFDGGQIDWTRDRWRGWVDAAVWIVALVATQARRDRLLRVLPRIAIVACLLQAAVTGYALATSAKDEVPVATQDADPVATLATFSPDRNVLHIIADGLQSDVVADLLAEDGGRMSRELDGFVFYTDHLAAFPYTHFAVPALLSGRVYDNSRKQAQALDDMLGHHSILGAARAAGYDVEAGIPAGGMEFVYGHAVDAHLMTLPNSQPGDARGTSGETLLLADLVLFRAAPHFVKRIVHNDQDWLLQSWFGNRFVAGHLFLAHEAVLRDLAARMTATRPRPTYKVIHVMLSHRPVTIKRDCTYAGKVLEMDRTNVGNQTRCGMGAVLAVLARMRELGIYDSATIVIGGDHGAYVPPARYTPGSHALAEAERRQYSPLLIGLARPALLVKPPHASGPVRVSQAPSWVVDTPATIADAAGIPGTFPGVSLLRLDEHAPRRRIFYFYHYDKSNWTSDYLPPITEVIVDGRSDDIDAWGIGRTFMPPAAGAAR
jgi:hypothetical protein